MLVQKAISHYLNSHIRLSKKDISEAARSRDWFLKRIENVINSRVDELKLYSGAYGDKFVPFGSYFKGTKVTDVDEFDVLVLIDSNSGMYSKSGERIATGEGAADPNPKYDGSYHKGDGTGVSPTKILNWMKGVVEEVMDSFDGEPPVIDGQAVTATIKSKDLKIDLVPAGVFVNNEEIVFYNIADGSKSNGWITTSPGMDITMLDETANGRINFKNVIRILKRIKSTYKLQISSFPIEMSVVHHALRNTWYQDLYFDTTGALRTLAEFFRSGDMPDIYNNDQNLLDGIDNLVWYADRLDNIADQLVVSHLKMTDEEKVKNKVVSLFENKT